METIKSAAAPLMHADVWISSVFVLCVLQSTHGGWTTKVCISLTVLENIETKSQPQETALHLVPGVPLIDPKPFITVARERLSWK